MAAKSETTGPPTSLLVTVGSTLFPELTSAVLTCSFARTLCNAGIQRILVQYGRAQLPWQMIMSLSMSVDAQGRAETVIRPFDTGDERQIQVEVRRFVDDFDGVVSTFDAVISHAGSGSIVTALRQGKKLLVVPNTSLMDNHQAQLADALGAAGYLTVSPVNGLESSVTGWLGGVTRQKEFPKQDTVSFKRVVDEVAGF